MYSASKTSTKLKPSIFGSYKKHHSLINTGNPSIADVDSKARRRSKLQYSSQTSLSIEYLKIFTAITGAFIPSVSSWTQLSRLSRRKARSKHHYWFVAFEPSLSYSIMFYALGTERLEAKWSLLFVSKHDSPNVNTSLQSARCQWVYFSNKNLNVPDILLLSLR